MSAKGSELTTTSADRDAPPIVAIGASAGGLEAIESFFSKITSPNRRAYVIVQHLSPDFKSLMAELLGRRTTLSVRQAIHGEMVQPDHIYLLPPAKTMVVVDGMLHLSDREQREMLHLPIDEFFTSLAADKGADAVGVILSGSGNDGARGTRAIIRAGGRVLVQSPDSAKFPSMPKAAIDAGADKEIMLPADMPKTIEAGEGSAPAQLPPPRISLDGLPVRLSNAIQQAYGMDLSAYKGSTVHRRITRRMATRGFETIEDYADLVASDPDEQEWLYYDLLIGVTSFFRDADAFDQIRFQVLPKLAELTARDEEIRIWVPACATGEEAYTIAIMLAEQLGDDWREGSVRIFATDIHKRSLAVAAAGSYGKDAVDGLDAEYLERYFIERDGRYHIKPAIRRMLIFSPHDLLKDPPFTKVDLISCRNFMIYLQPEAQKRVLATFTYALNKGGYLFLGPSESLLENERDYDELDKAWRIFRKRRTLAAPAALDPAHTVVERSLSPIAAPLSPRAAPTVRRDQRLALAYEALLERYVPPSALVDERGELIHSFGDAGPFLAFHPGRASLAVHDMIDQALRRPLTTAIGRVRRTGKSVTLTDLRFGPDQEKVLHRLTVEPIFSRSESQTYMLVSFDHSSDAVPEEVIHLDLSTDTNERMQALERDLRFTEENLQNTIEELETSNEELQASNEELMASNEELQSTNEELHSVNEELHTVSAEHQRKIEELTELGQDMDSLLSSTDVAAVFVDRSLRIRRYTPAITRLFNLMPQDLGRPIEHITHMLDLETLSDDIHRVIKHAKPELFEVSSDHSELRMDIRPYLDSNGKVAGAALSFTDITEYRKNPNATPAGDKDIDHYARLLSPLEAGSQAGEAMLNTLYRGLVPLALPAQRSAACDLAAMLRQASENCGIEVELGNLPQVHRDPAMLQWILDAIMHMAALRGDPSKLVCSGSDTGKLWRVTLSKPLKLDGHDRALADAAAVMIGAVTDRIQARFRIDDSGCVIDLDKMRGDRLIIDSGKPADPAPEAEAATAETIVQANPRLAKSR